MFAQYINISITIHRDTSMKEFKEFLAEDFGFLTEAAGSSMVGSINDSEKKGLRHLRNYVIPTLSKTQKRSVLAAFARHLNPGDFDKEHGSAYDPAKPNKPTHTLTSKYGAHAAGTTVTATGAYHDDQGKIFIKTKQHGDIPQSKLGVPSGLAKSAFDKGFKVEEVIAKNFGTKAAGSTGTAYDFVSHQEPGTGKATKDKRLQGKIKEVSGEETEEQIETPFTRLQGESKLERGKMGQSACNFNQKTGKWELTSAKLGKHFAKVKVDGMPLLQYLNEKHSKGKINKTITIPSPRGMARAYLGSSEINALHIHNGKTDKGTTFTIGDDNPLIGKTTLGHLTNRDIDRLDGKIQIANTDSGKTQVIHRPHEPTMRTYANLSVDQPELHRDVTNEDHAAEVKKLLDSHRKTLSENISNLLN
jgi:hypothetical protein